MSDSSLSVKLILLGESGIGKTNLINIYLGENYNPNELTTSNPCQTDTIKVINNKKLIVSLWDTMGQEKYRSVSKSFIRGSNIVIFVYDITRRDTFLELNYWVNVVNEEIGDEETLFGIAANKIDLFEKSQVEKEEGEEYAQKINALFYETSAKADVGFKNLVNQLLEKFVLNKNKTDEVQDNEKNFSLKNQKGETNKKKKTCC
jgi:small GTP-binding protein